MRERIKLIIEREGMSQSQFADFIEVNRPTLSHILAGRNNPSMEVVMKIHQKFPKINVLWLLDGIGSYESNVIADYPNGSLVDNKSVIGNSSDIIADTPHVQSELPGTSSSVTTEEHVPSRFYQGELFSENTGFATENTGSTKNRKEMPLPSPSKAPYLSDTQIEYAKKCLQRKIVEIKIFYDDGTYETFSHE